MRIAEYDRYAIYGKFDTHKFMQMSGDTATLGFKFSILLTAYAIAATCRNVAFLLRDENRKVCAMCGVCAQVIGPIFIKRNDFAFSVAFTYRQI